MTRGRLRSVLLTSASACVVALALVGCGPSPKPDPPRTPDPIPTPLYSSDEEALAAAKDAYAKYVEVSNQVGHDGWKDLSSLKTVATGRLLKGDIRSGQANRERGYRVEGDITAEVDKLQRIDVDAVVVYICVDVGQTRVVDSAGLDQTGSQRPPVVPLEVEFVKRADSLVPSRSDTWVGQSFC